MRTLRVVVALVLGPLVGCSPSPTKTDLDPNEKHILKVASLYSDFRSKNGRPPKTIDELKTFARKLSKQELQNRGIEDLEAAFVSPRDHQPYKVAPPSPPKRGGPPMPLVALYEQAGVGGKRMVASGLGGGAFEWDDAKLREHVPNP